MASNINSVSIDGNFPVAGVDNSTQGFRENFTIIKDSLAAAKTEIEDLQNKAVLKAALTGTELLNDFNGNTIQEANFKACTEQTFSVEIETNSNPGISFTNGSYQKVIVKDDGLSIILKDWPAAGKRGRIIVEVYADNNLTLTTNFSAGIGILRKSTDWPQTIVVNDTTPQVFEFWTINTGATVLGKYLGDYTGRSQQDLDNAGTVDLKADTIYFSTTGTETATLPAGTNGQTKTFAMLVDGGDMVITVENAGWKTSGSGTITFSDIGDACVLKYISNKWVCISNNSVTFN